ncbi:hypothetical protein ACFLZ6_02025 [Nanoarchaeota archaeon]
MGRYLRYIIIGLLLLSIVNPVSAMGLRAYKMWVRLDYAPNLEFSQEYQIVTTASYSQDYEMYLEGDLRQYLTIEPMEFKNIAPGQNPSFTVSMYLPEGLDKEIKPGTHQIRIGVRETSSAGGGGIGVLTGSEAIIDVKFLYPGKYLTANLRVDDVEVNKPAEFEISLNNGGKEDINSVRSMIDVYDAANNKIATIYTEEKPLKTNSNDILHASLDTTGLKSGEYNAVATVYYDGQELKTDKAKFKVGSLEVFITDYTKEVFAGKINPFDVEIESRWNSEISDVYAAVIVGNQEFETPTTTVKPWEKKTIAGYLDTTEMEVGEYDAEITVHYSDKATKEIGKVTIIEPEDVLLAPVSSTTTLLIIIIVLLVIADIIYLIYSKRKREKDL